VVGVPRVEDRIMELTELAGLDTSSRIQMAVAKKQLDAQRDEGKALVSLIQSAAQSAPQGRGGVNAAGPGGLDLTA